MPGTHRGPGSSAPHPAPSTPTWMEPQTVRFCCPKHPKSWPTPAGELKPVPKTKILVSILQGDKQKQKLEAVNTCKSAYGPRKTMRKAMSTSAGSDTLKKPKAKKSHKRGWNTNPPDLHPKDALPSGPLQASGYPRLPGWWLVVAAAMLSGKHRAGSGYSSWGSPQGHGPWDPLRPRRLPGCGQAPEPLSHCGHRAQPEAGQPGHNARRCPRTSSCCHCQALSQRH